MCLSVPGKIISVDETNPDLRMGKVDFSGVVKEVCLQWLPEAVIGNYVLVHVGFALSLVDEADALATISQLQEMGEALEREDTESGIDPVVSNGEPE
jgi:hydrogenase expression/formation protein HypC